METKNKTISDPSYSKWEAPLDVLSCGATSTLSCLTNNISLLDPSGLGILLAAGTSMLSATAVNKFLDSKQIESKFFKICAIIAALAISAFSLPLLISSLGLHSYLLLSSQTAIEIAGITIATKVAFYAVFKTFLFFKDYLFFSFPKGIHEIARLDAPSLLQLKTHLINFPGKAQYLSLPFQVALNKTLEEKKLGNFPLISFSDLGKEWSREELRALHAQDLSKIALHKKAAINELFMHHNFPPQNRAYSKDELPNIDTESIEKSLSQPRAIWYHLILRLEPATFLHPKINEQFYTLKLPPPRAKAIDLPLPESEKAIEQLADYQVSWYQLLFKENGAKWSELSTSLQEAFNNRLSEKIALVTPTITKDPLPSLNGRVSQAINWKKVAIISFVSIAFFATAFYMMQPSAVDVTPELKDIKPITDKIFPKLLKSTSGAHFSFWTDNLLTPTAVKKVTAQLVENFKELNSTSIPDVSASKEIISKLSETCLQKDYFFWSENLSTPTPVEKVIPKLLEKVKELNSTSIPDVSASKEIISKLSKTCLQKDYFFWSENLSIPTPVEKVIPKLLEKVKELNSTSILDVSASKEIISKLSETCLQKDYFFWSENLAEKNISILPKIFQENVLNQNAIPNPVVIPDFPELKIANFQDDSTSSYTLSLIGFLAFGAFSALYYLKSNDYDLKNLRGKPLNIPTSGSAPLGKGAKKVNQVNAQQARLKKSSASRQPDHNSKNNPATKKLAKSNSPKFDYSRSSHQTLATDLQPPNSSINFGPSTPIGIKNATRNNCWANSIIQLCANAPSFAAKIKESNGKACRVLKTMLDQYTNDQKMNEKISGIDSQSLRKAMHTNTKEGITLNRQEDAMDGLRFVLDEIQIDPLIKTTFEYIEELQGYSSRWPTEESYGSLPLYLNNNELNFEQLLANNFSDYAEDTNQLIKYEFKNPPEDLIIDARRFKRENGRAYKINSSLQNVPHQFEICKTLIQKSKVNIKYELSSCIRHIGDSVGNGHYTTLVKKEGVWYLIDDSKVHLASKQEIKKHIEESYIFHYAQVKNSQLNAQGNEPSPVIKADDSAFQKNNSHLPKLSQSYLGVHFNDGSKATRVLLDINNPNTNDYLSNLLQANPSLPQDLQDLAGQQIHLRNPLIIEKIKELSHSQSQQKPLKISSTPKKRPKIAQRDHTKIDWVAFEEYVKRDCKSIGATRAKILAEEGIQLYQRLRRNEKIEPTDLEHQLSAFCWGLMAHTVSKNADFINGTFDLKDPEHRIFNFFLPALQANNKNQSGLQTDNWQSYRGFDSKLHQLPSKKQTVVLGKITTKDGIERTCFKMEDWGPSPDLDLNPQRIANRSQHICHSLESISFVPHRTVSEVFADGAGKLILNQSEKKLLEYFINKTSEEANIPNPKIKLNDHGFVAGFAFLEKQLNSSKISEVLKTTLNSFLVTIFKRYDHLSPQNKNKSNQGSINLEDSILNYQIQGSDTEFKVVGSNGAKAKVKELDLSENIGPNLDLDEFDLLGESFSDLEPFEALEKTSAEPFLFWKESHDALLGTRYLNGSTVNIYADYLKEKGEKTNKFKINSICDLLFVNRMTDEKKNRVVKDIVETVNSAKDDHPIFIPFILEGSWKAWFGASFFADHIVTLVLDPKTKSIEYYNSQAGDITAETRKVLGLDLNAKQLLEQIRANLPNSWKNAKLKNNPHVHQRDYINCGAFVCWFIKKRSRLAFDQICTDTKININDERNSLARDLSAFYTTKPLRSKTGSVVVNPPKIGCGKVRSKSLENFLQDNLIQNTANLERDHFFEQIDQHLTLSSITINGTAYHKAEDIYECFKKLKSKDGKELTEDKIFKLMMLLQAETFSSIQMDITKELITENQQLTSIEKACHFGFLIDEHNFNFSCINKYRLANSSIQAMVGIDLSTEQGFESWEVTKT